MKSISDSRILSPSAYSGFFAHPKCEFLTGIRDYLNEILIRNLDPLRNNQMELWKRAIAALPAEVHQDQSAGAMQPEPTVANGRVRVGGDAGAALAAEIEQGLRELMPWRKGPWDFFGIHVDTEWRSDWKWDRVLPHIAELTGRRVLDIGCGNGYHLWRMREAGADAAVGIEPHLLNVAQYSLMQRWFPDLPLTVLPMTLEEYPVNTRIYDTVFSMGVLYHRKSPVDHLIHCKSCLREGGELVLETLVVPGDVNSVLVPEDRYGKMPNVWNIPSAELAMRLLRRVGFRNIRLVDVNRTSVEEQRSTDWMRFESLADYLDPSNPDLTVEGYPAPRRAVIIAESP